MFAPPCKRKSMRCCETSVSQIKSKKLKRIIFFLIRAPRSSLSSTCEHSQKREKGSAHFRVARSKPKALALLAAASLDSGRLDLQDTPRAHPSDGIMHFGSHSQAQGWDVLGLCRRRKEVPMRVSGAKTSHTVYPRDPLPSPYSTREKGGPQKEATWALGLPERNTFLDLPSFSE